MSNVFLLSWDCEGLEACINISDAEKSIMWATLKNEKPDYKIGNMVSMMMLRARSNPQRHYEIYTIHVDKSITEKDLRRMFDDSPQSAVDLIRERGNKIFSDRANHNRVKIV